MWLQEGLSEDFVLDLLKRYVEKGSIVDADGFLIYAAEVERGGYEHKIFQGTMEGGGSWKEMFT